jgi:diaminopimelate epimerase
MRLIKSHGLGNDYLVLASDSVLTPARVKALCERHTGVGGDGVLEPVAAERGDFGLRIWNPDGSQAEKSGNGLRIYARWLVDHQLAPLSFTVEVPAGVCPCTVDPASGAVTVGMGLATLEPADIPCTEALRDTPVVVDGDPLRLTAVGMGNPHCVAFFDTDLDALPWRRWGAALETDARFPHRTNVQLARVLDRENVEARIWERGAGETRASGSSACAIAVAARVLGHTDGRVTVHMPGGRLQVHVDDDLSVTQTGPVEEVGEVFVRMRLPRD